MPRMVEMIIDSVRVSLTNQQRVVVLRELDSERYLPIWIGPFEAESITIALQEIILVRPQTHDLLKTLIQTMGGRLVRVEVVSLREDVFYGSLVVELNGEMINVDSRPSDAIALAVRAHVPILVAREILDVAGVLPEEDIENTTSEGLSSEGEGEKPAGGDRLSVFEDFLEGIEFDEPDSKGEDSEADGENPEPDKS